MSDAAELSQDNRVNRAYAAWATKPAALPRFITRRTTGTMIRFQSGGLGHMALIVCAMSVAGLAGIAVMTLQ